MFALNTNKPNTKKPKLPMAAAAFGLVALALSAPAEARGLGGFHGGMGGIRGGGMMRGSGGFGRPVRFAHPGFAGSAFFGHPNFVGRPFFSHRRFADDRRFFFRRHRFIGPLAVGFAGAYDYPYDDSGIYGEECFVVRHRVVNPWGYVVVRRSLVCG
jgi:hypothetical protein